MEPHVSSARNMGVAGVDHSCAEQKTTTAASPYSVPLQLDHRTIMTETKTVRRYPIRAR